MTSDSIENIAKLRCCVAFLGEKDQLSWWSSTFLSKNGHSFMNPVFPKTSFLARVRGASAAAQSVHDMHIGIGDVFHLFRLPENIEQEISQLLTNDTPSNMQDLESKEDAYSCLEGLANKESKYAVGALLLEENIVKPTGIQQMASAYLTAFKNNEKVYPYYKGQA